MVPPIAPVSNVRPGPLGSFEAALCRMPGRLSGVVNRAASAVLLRSEGTRMTTHNAGVAGYTCNSRLVEEDRVAIEVGALRREIKRQDRAFVARLRAAILAGTETPHRVLGYVRRPRD